MEVTESWFVSDRQVRALHKAGLSFERSVRGLATVSGLPPGDDDISPLWMTDFWFPFRAPVLARLCPPCWREPGASPGSAPAGDEAVWRLVR